MAAEVENLDESVAIFALARAIDRDNVPPDILRIAIAALTIRLHRMQRDVNILAPGQ